MADVYIESPLDRIVDVHFGGPETPPGPYSGTLTFVPSGITFVIPGAEGPDDSANFSNVVMTGNAFSVAENDDFVRVLGGTTCHVEADIHAEITGGTPAGSTLLEVYLLVRSTVGAVLGEGGPVAASHAAPTADGHFTIGSIAIPLAGIDLKIAFRATGNPITLGFGRTFPGVVSMVVS